MELGPKDGTQKVSVQKLEIPKSSTTLPNELCSCIQKLIQDDSKDFSCGGFGELLNLVRHKSFLYTPDTSQLRTAGRAHQTTPAKTNDAKSDTSLRRSQAANESKARNSVRERKAQHQIFARPGQYRRTSKTQPN